MRFVHTSDWHLGRLLAGRHLTDDQRHVLEQLVALLERLAPDALLVSGDVYDRALPPVEAVRLLEWVLERVVLDLRIPTLLIAGNHDDGDRLGFGSRFLRAEGLHVAGSLHAIEHPLVLEDEHGPVAFHRLAYVEPEEVRVRLGVAAADHEAALKACLARAPREPAARHVLLAHAFVRGGEVSDSERPLSVGGAGTVSASVFDGFDYVALGHLHRPQTVAGRGHVRYSGSLLKYSFSEAAHRKAVLEVELDGAGAVTVTEHALVPARDVRVLTGTLAELLARGADDPGREDYVQLRLTNPEALLDPMGRAREVYPNALALELAGRRGGAGAGRAAPTRGRADLELFRDFFRAVEGEDLDPAQEAALREALAEAARDPDRGGAEGAP